MKVQGRNVVITGAGAGFGAALLQRLRNEGAHVIAIDSDASALDALRAQYDAHVSTYCCDVGDAAAVESTIARLLAEHSTIDVLVNNAGLMKNQPLVNLMNREQPAHSLELWQDIINVNLNGPFYVTRLLAAQMLRTRTKGVIVNITSVAAAGNAGQSAYSASKAGLTALTKVWADELGPLGIRCAAVAPGFADTAGTHAALDDSRLQQWVERVPLRRLARVDEVVDAICFVIGNDFINGKIIEVDGGLTI